MDGGVEHSYTKFHDAIDNNPYNLVQPPENLLYIGWGVAGVWGNMAVEVEPAGVYTAALLYTSSGGGHISFDVNGKNSLVVSLSCRPTMPPTRSPGDKCTTGD